MDLKGEFNIHRDDTRLFHQQTMQFPNLNNEQAGQMKEYMDACEKDLAKIARKPGPGTFTITLQAEADGVAMSTHKAEGISYKDLVQFQRKMHNHQDKLLKYAEEQAEQRPPAEGAPTPAAR